jgi:hypothetical protein
MNAMNARIDALDFPTKVKVIALINEASTIWDERPIPDGVATEKTLGNRLYKVDPELAALYRLWREALQSDYEGRIKYDPYHAVPAHQRFRLIVGRTGGDRLALFVRWVRRRSAS